VNQGGRSDQPVDYRQLRPPCKIAPAGGLWIADDQDALSEKLTQAAQPARQPISARRIGLAALHDAFGDFPNGEHTLTKWASGPEASSQRITFGAGRRLRVSDTMLVSRR
jgi:hypothetical protein